MSSAAGTGSERAGAIARFCAEHFEGSHATDFGLDLEGFTAIVAAVVEHCQPTDAELEQLLSSLRLEELVLTRACADGNNTAWERFLNRYRPTLYSAAYKVASDEASARELADSLYASLYGVSEGGKEGSSKLMYYSGRGSLEGWLRTVVAQEYVNRYRRGRRETSLDEAVEQGRQFEAPAAPNVPAADQRLDTALASEIAALEPEERFLLASYFLDGRTLAEIGRLMRVHESTISRKLERATATLRKRVRKRLIDSGMSSRQTDELMQEVDVRDIQLPLAKSLRQETQSPTFYKEGREPKSP
jgi:RNA polymerase sigma-70 factor